MRKEMTPKQEKSSVEAYKEEYDSEFFKEKLKEILKDKNMTQKELAEKIGIQAAAFTKYFDGTNRPSFRNISEMARVLDVRVEALYSKKFYNELEEYIEARHDQASKLIDQIRLYSSLLIYLEDIGYKTAVSADGWHSCVYSPEDKQQENSLVVNDLFAKKIEAAVKKTIADTMYDNWIRRN